MKRKLLQLFALLSVACAALSGSALADIAPLPREELVEQGGGIPAWSIVLIAVLVLAAALLILYLVRRNRKP